MRRLPMLRLGAIVGLLLSLAVMALVTVRASDLPAWFGVGYAGIFVIALLNTATLFIPGATTVTVFFAARSLDPVLLCGAAALGTTLGESNAYLVGLASRHVVEASTTELTWRLRLLTRVRRTTFLALLLLAVLPNPLLEVLVIAVARAEYPYGKFFLAILAGKLVQFAVLIQLSLWLLNRI